MFFANVRIASVLTAVTPLPGCSEPPGTGGGLPTSPGGIHSFFTSGGVWSPGLWNLPSSEVF